MIDESQIAVRKRIARQLKSRQQSHVSAYRAALLGKLACSPKEEADFFPETMTRTSPMDVMLSMKPEERLEGLRSEMFDDGLVEATSVLQ